jgi:hypothetical protein
MTGIKKANEKKLKYIIGSEEDVLSREANKRKRFFTIFVCG